MPLIALWHAVGYFLVVLVVYLSLAPEAPVLPGPSGDLASHTLAYGVLMAWFAQVDPPGRGRILRALMLVTLAVGLEFAQGLTGYRTFDERDMLAGVVGVALGWLLAPPRVPDVASWARSRWIRPRDG